MINKKHPILSNYSEGNYDGLLGIDMTDYSQENLKRMRDWAQKTYYQALTHPSPTFTDLEGKTQDISIKYKSEQKKFEYICQKCNVKRGMRILEIGFGECDFLKYIYEHYGIRTVGVSISKEQVANAKSLGFEAHCMNSWDMTDELGTFDLILQCGNLEYNRLVGESQEVFTDFFNVVHPLLNDRGKYFITCCHNREDYDYSWFDCVRIYFLWAGNDGGYPTGKDGLTKYAKKAGFQVVYQEDRTIHYYVNEMLYFSFLRCVDQCHTVVEAGSLLRALFLTIAAPYFIHSYLCYQPSKYLPVAPFAFQFEPQFRKEWKSPMTLEYILLEKS